MLILHIEDDPVTIEMMTQIARLSGHELMVATTGRAALALLDQVPDIILLDLGLPDIDGLSLVAPIRELLPNVPLIAVTAHTRLEDEQACRTVGCTGFVSKPFKFGEMRALLSKYAHPPVRQ